MSAKPLQLNQRGLNQVLESGGNGIKKDPRGPTLMSNPCEEMHIYIYILFGPLIGKVPKYLSLHVYCSAIAAL